MSKSYCKYLIFRRRRYVAEAGQRHRQSPLRWSGRCVTVWHTSGASAAGPRCQARLPAEPATGPLPAHRQQARDEAIRLKESAHEGTHPAEGRRTLGHSSVQ